MSAQSSFATLIPVNYDAQTLNSKSIQSMRSGDDKYHLQFVKQNPIPALSAEDTVSPKSLEDSSTEYDSVSSSDSELIKGHFTLSFHQDKLPAKPHLGWRVGKGTSRFDDRNVDFLLAAPRDPKSKHLASVHMFFQFSWSSGMLMLIAASKERSVHYCLDGEWMELKHPSKRVLCHKSNRLRLDKFEYELVYRIPLDRKIEFYAERDAYLRSLSDWPLPKNNQWLAAMENGFTKQGRMLIFQSIGFGAFGWVWEGVDSTTGDLVAIKALYLKKKGDRALLEKELDMGLEFRVS